LFSCWLHLTIKNIPSNSSTVLLLSKLKHKLAQILPKPSHSVPIHGGKTVGVKHAAGGQKMPRNMLRVGQQEHSTVVTVRLLQGGSRGEALKRNWLILAADGCRQGPSLTLIGRPGRVEVVEGCGGDVVHEKAPVSAARCIWIALAVDGKEGEGFFGQAEGVQGPCGFARAH
jgi:hypothetical protein